MARSGGRRTCPQRANVANDAFRIFDFVAAIASFIDLAEANKMRALTMEQVVRRRDFLGILGGAAAIGPLPAIAQQYKSPVRLGFLPLGSSSNPYDMSLVEAFRQGLREQGYIADATSSSTIATLLRGRPTAPMFLLANSCNSGSTS